MRLLEHGFCLAVANLDFSVIFVNMLVCAVLYIF